MESGKVDAPMRFLTAEIEMENIKFKCVGVVGSGQMGTGIAQVCATSGYQVFISDIRKEALEQAQKNIQLSLEKLTQKGILQPGIGHQALERLNLVSNLQNLTSCDLVIEAVNEDLELKKEILKNLDEILPETSIIASNTSSLSITKLARHTRRPAQMIGIHFMNPVPLMSLVEVIVGLKTDHHVLERTLNFCRSLGKETVQSKDYPGFIVNRILMPMINEAFEALKEGIATAEDIDRGMKLGTNQPMGPLALADFIGLDTCLAILEVMHQGLGDPKYRPSPLLRQYVDAGQIGRKVKHGVYRYE
jgi:3-hydroxybutyryl-CoA dehydrogenase